MLILLSPAKSLDFDPSPVGMHTLPDMLDDAGKLVRIMRRRSESAVAELMSLSPKLAALNVERYRQYDEPFVLNQGAKQALLAFKGDVYRDWPLTEYSDQDFEYSQQHLRILSGLYGLLRPMDLIMPYRLEMGTRLKSRRGKDLYAFWGERITKAINAAVAEADSSAVVNLASNEYFSSVKAKKLKKPLVSPVFKDFKNGKFKIISFYAKRARGSMAHWILKNRVENPDALAGFNLDGYAYEPGFSTAESPVFHRRLE